MHRIILKLVKKYYIMVDRTLVYMACNSSVRICQVFGLLLHQTTELLFVLVKYNII